MVSEKPDAHVLVSEATKVATHPKGGGAKGEGEGGGATGGAMGVPSRLRIPIENRWARLLKGPVIDNPVAGRPAASSIVDAACTERAVLTVSTEMSEVCRF